jgi:hypothetical protein
MVSFDCESTRCPFDDSLCVNDEVKWERNWEWRQVHFSARGIERRRRTDSGDSRGRREPET